MSILLKTLQIFDASGTLKATITDDTSLNVRISKGRNGGVTVFTLKNPVSSYDGTNTYGKHAMGTVGNKGEFDFDIDKEWTVKLFLKYSDTKEVIDTSSTTDLIMTSDITEVEAKMSEKQSTWKLTCTDKSFLLLSRLWSFNFTESAGKNSPEMIQEIIRATTGTGKGVSASAVIANLVDSNTPPIEGIQNRRPDGSSFPTIVVGKLHKPVYEWIEDLSQPDMLNSAVELASGTIPAPRPFYFYVDEQNRAIWESPSLSTSDYTFTIGDTTSDYNIYSFTLKRGQIDTVNMVIFNAGEDFFGSGILGYNYDKTTTATKLKPVYRPWIKITEVMKNEEIKGANTAKYSEDNATPGTLVFQDKRYDASGSYSFTPTWTDTAVADDAELNTSLRDKSDDVGKNMAKNIFDGKGSPLWTGKIELKGYKFRIGELITFTSTIHGINSALLRIADVQHNIGKDGWFTTLTVKEDNPAIAG